jgi:hypothetical protein
MVLKERTSNNLTRIRKRLKQTRIRVKRTNFKQSKVRSIQGRNSTGNMNKFMKITGGDSFIRGKERSRIKLVESSRWVFICLVRLVFSVNSLRISRR